MSKEKKLVPKLRFEQFKQNDNWIQDKVGEYYFFKNGLNKGKEYFGYGIPIVNYMDVFQRRRLYTENLKGKVNVTHAEAKNYNVLKGDIFFTRTSETLEEIGYPSVILDRPKNVVFSGFVLRARPKNTDPLDINFKSYVFFTSSFRSEMIKMSSMSTRALTSGTAIKKMKFNFPKNKSEQEKIGSFFKNIDKMIQLQQDKVNKVKDIKLAYLSEMFPKEGEKYPKRRFEGFSEPWIERTLNSLGDIITGTTPSTKNEAYYSENGIPWITPTDIHKNITYASKRHLSEEGQKVSKVVPKDTILVTSIASIGKNTLLGRAGSFNQQINGLIPDQGYHNPYFLFMQSLFWSNKMKQSAASGTMQIVNKTEFSKITTKIPVLAEQEKIGQFFKNLDNQISNEKEKLDKLEKLKQAYLNDMFV